MSYFCHVHLLSRTSGHLGKGREARRGRYFTRVIAEASHHPCTSWSGIFLSSPSGTPPLQVENPVSRGQTLPVRGQGIRSGGVDRGAEGAARSCQEVGKGSEAKSSGMRKEDGQVPLPLLSAGKDGTGPLSGGASQCPPPANPIHGHTEHVQELSRLRGGNWGDRFRRELLIPLLPVAAPLSFLGLTKEPWCSPNPFPYPRPLWVLPSLGVGACKRGWAGPLCPGNPWATPLLPGGGTHTQPSAILTALMWAAGNFPAA